MIEFIDTFLSASIIRVFGWTLLHSLWQGAIIALFLKSILLIVGNRSSNTNYIISIIALVLLLAVSARTFIMKYDILTYQSELKPQTVQIFNNNLDYNVPQPVLSKETQLNFKEYINNNIQYIFFIWLVGTFYFCIKLLLSSHYTSRIKKYNTIDPPTDVQNFIEKIRIKLEVPESLKVIISPKIQSPMATGFLRPYLFLPLEIISGLPKEQLEIIIAHELAHIARADYLINLIQSIIEIIFFFNPAVWWISNSIRNERENCCDDLAIKLCGNRIVLAKALLNLNKKNDTKFSTAMSFANKNKQLLGRIKRMSNQKQNHSRLFGIMFSSLLTLLVISGIISNQSSSTNKSIQNASLLDNNFSIDGKNIENNIFGDERTLIFYARKDGKRVKWEVELDKYNEITSLEIDGDDIDESDFSEYSDVIYDKIDNLDKEWDYDHTEFDSERFNEEMEHLTESLSSLKNLDVNIDFDHEEFEESMKEWAEEMSNFKVDVNFDSEKLRESLENIEIDIDLEELNTSLAELKVNLKNLDIDMESLEVEMSKLKEYLNEVKDELISDGIIDEDDNDFSMELNKSKMVVNGKRLPDSLHKKYEKMYEEHYDEELKEDRSITIH